MASNNNGADFEASAGQQATEGEVPQLSKQELKRAEKEARRAEKKAAKEAKKAKKAGAGNPPVPVDAQPQSQPQPQIVENAAPAAFPQTVEGMYSPAVDQGTPVPAVLDGQEGEVQAYPYEDNGHGFVPASVGDANPYSRYAYMGSADAEATAQVEANRKRRKRRRTVAVVLIVILCLFGVGAAGALVYVNSLNQNLAGEDKKEAQEIKEVLTPAPVGDEPFYMLLMGCDDREGVEGVRADTTILARLDPKTNTATLISIPRDTYIELPGYGPQKFNAAYALGGPSATIEAASKLCGVPISHYAEVHFEALISIIDYIGGVDLDIPIPIDDVDAGGKLDAGYQHLNGEQAMVFARSRSYASGDFQRTTSQRILIEAAVKKVMTLPPTELPGLLMKVSQCLNTDFTVQQLLGLAMAFQDEPPLTMYSALVPSTTMDLDGIAYVVTNEEQLTEMMAVVNEGGDPSTVVSDDYTVTSSDAARAAGIELIVNYGDEDVTQDGRDIYARFVETYGGGEGAAIDGGTAGAQDSGAAGADTGAGYAEVYYDDGGYYYEGAGYVDNTAGGGSDDAGYTYYEGAGYVDESGNVEDYGYEYTDDAGAANDGGAEGGYVGYE